MKKILILSALLLFVGSLAVADTYTVHVQRLMGSGTDYKDIMVIPNDVVLSPADQIEVVVDSNLWCEGDPGDPNSGTLSIDVPTDTCGFNDSTYVVAENDPHGDQTQALAGAVDNANVKNMTITITYDDGDCTAETSGANTVELRVYCNRDIPTLSEWGLIIFSLLILTLITVVMTRRKRATAGTN